MNYRIFFIFDLVGGFLWVFGLCIAGYLLGEIEWIRKNIDLVCLGIIFLSVSPLIFKILNLNFIKKT